MRKHTDPAGEELPTPDIESEKTGEPWAYSPDAMRAYGDARERALLAKLGGQRPVAFMWQHSETGRAGFVDPWQIENGWQAANPRCAIVKPLYAAPVPSAPVRDKQTDEEREFREWCMSAASSEAGSASITARNAWNARAALANIAVGAYLGKMTLRDRDTAMDASLNELQIAAYAEGRKDEREDRQADAARALLEALRPFVDGPTEYLAGGVYEITVNGRDLIAARAAIEAATSQEAPKA